MPMCLHEIMPYCHCAACCSCLAGGIMELNQRLVASPDLLRTHAETTGYVAIRTPMKKDRMLALARTMVTRPVYEALRAGGSDPVTSETAGVPAIPPPQVPTLGAL